jgi:nucleolar protein 14
MIPLVLCRIVLLNISPVFPSFVFFYPNAIRKAIPFVFDVPTTLDALHNLISIHASTGAEASLIIQRIHASNSVRLNKSNKEKMQNFYDVLLRRFLAVGDAIYRSGDGGENLARQEQLNSLTKTLYKMSQDSPECAGAVWSRRLGILQKALAKRLRDVELMGGSSSSNNNTEEEEDCYTAWPSMGTILLLRACGHIFPVTDLRHPVVTPVLLLLGQTIAQCPVRTVQDVVMGLLCSGIMIEYTKESKRIAPEAISFIAGVIRLFAADVNGALESMPLPTLASSLKHAKIDYLRDRLSKCEEYYEDPQVLPRLSLQKLEEVRDPFMAASIIASALRLVKVICSIYEGSLQNAEAETFSEFTNALLLINPKCKKFPLPPALAAIVASTASDVAKCCKLGQPKVPLRRQAAAATSEVAVVSLAPRMEDLTRYTPGKDKGKHQLQAQRDKIRREYKREHKAVARELRLDAAFIESERRKEKDLKDRKAREKRHKNFAWMEQEQATINQQVAQGGALLRGGGIAIARRKAASAKIGIKKGGKLR